MKIETKIAINNIKEHKKRTMFTIISVILCTALIFTTILLLSSIKYGMENDIETEYNDYHFVLKDISKELFDEIRNKPYIDKIYVQEVEGRRFNNSRRFL